jgi:DNA-binding NtrC family response regulator
MINSSSPASFSRSAMLTPAYAAPASDETLVLILDSDPAVAEFLADYLSEHGMHPLACLGLSQACDLLTTQPDIRLAVVDINHQPGGGLAAVDELLMERPHLQVIYLSSMSTGQPGEWQRALDQGAHDIIAKPLNGPRLLAALDRAVSASDQCRTAHQPAGRPDWAERQRRLQRQRSDCRPFVLRRRL